MNNIILHLNLMITESGPVRGGTFGPTISILIGLLSLFHITYETVQQRASLFLYIAKSQLYIKDL